MLTGKRFPLKFYAEETMDIVDLRTLVGIVNSVNICVSLMRIITKQLFMSKYVTLKINFRASIQMPRATQIAATPLPVAPLR